MSLLMLLVGGSSPTSVSYLPTTSASPVNGWWVGRKINSAYSGAIIRIVKPSNQSNSLDIYAGSNEKLDVSGVAAFLGSDTYGEINIIYDQYDSANKTIATRANRPWLPALSLVKKQ